MARGSVSIPSPPERPGPPVRVRDLDAGYGTGPARVDVLRGVDLSADPGRVTALVGPNGAGKTTLFRVLLGFLPPWSGSVRVGGLPPRSHRLSRGVGCLPESIQPPGGWTAGDLFLEGARLAGLPRRLRADAVTRAVERAFLDPASLQRPLARLSRGMGRRAQLAYALVGEPGLVLLDEPWSGLDPPARARLRHTIRELTRGGATVILASHELDEVQRASDRAVLLHRGRVVETLDDPGSMPPGSLEEALLGGPPPSPPGQ